MSELPDEADVALNTLQGVKFFRRLRPLLGRLRDEACERDRAGNRELFFDHLCGLILLTFFNPTLRSLRDLSSASRLTQVKKKIGCGEASLGSLSESLRVFDSNRLVEITQELLGKIPDSPAEATDPHSHGGRRHTAATFASDHASLLRYTQRPRLETAHALRSAPRCTDCGEFE